MTSVRLLVKQRTRQSSQTNEHPKYSEYRELPLYRVLVKLTHKYWTYNTICFEQNSAGMRVDSLHCESKLSNSKNTKFGFEKQLTQAVSRRNHKCIGKRKHLIRRVSVVRHRLDSQCNTVAKLYSQQMYYVLAWSIKTVQQTEKKLTPQVYVTKIGLRSSTECLSFHITQTWGK